MSSNYSLRTILNYEWKRTGDLDYLNHYLQHLCNVQMSTEIEKEGWYHDDFEQHTILVIHIRVINSYEMYFWFNCDPRKPSVV